MDDGIKVLFVSDGERDHRTIPILCRKVLDRKGVVLGAITDEDTRQWGRKHYFESKTRKVKLHLMRQRTGRVKAESARGFGGKLKFLVGQIRDNNERVSKEAGRSCYDALIAVVDQDVDPADGRLEALRRARKEMKEKGTLDFPIAIGRAIPHGEAWILDNKDAVARVLGCQVHEVPNVDEKVRGKRRNRKASPKAWLNSAIKERCPVKHGRGSEGQRVIDYLVRIAENCAIEDMREPDKTGFKAFAEDLAKEFGGD